MAEAWLSGPVDGVPGLLQPVAHALVQVRAELHELAPSIPESILWSRPNDVAAVGFHLQHLRGVIDRLFSYARGEQLSDAQKAAFKAEGNDASGALTVASLVAAFDAQVETALSQLRATPEAALTEARFVGRAMLPSTVIGLLFHAAEHSTRHFGQLLVTVRLQQGA
jgi:uncharacterized damage-inducible protein DinB